MQRSGIKSKKYRHLVCSLLKIRSQVAVYGIVYLLYNRPDQLCRRHGDPCAQRCQVRPDRGHRPHIPRAFRTVLLPEPPAELHNGPAHRITLRTRLYQCFYPFRDLHGNAAVAKIQDRSMGNTFCHHRLPPLWRSAGLFPGIVSHHKP